VRDFEQRHAGDDRALLFSRLALYAKARECDAARWSGNTRNWTPVGAVMHTPECDSVDAMASLAADKQPLAARRPSFGVVPVWDSGMRLLRYSLRLSREELSLCLTGIPGVAEFISQFVDPAVCPTREAPQWWWALRYGGETSQCSSYRLARHTRRCTSRVGGRTVVSLKLFAESVKMILSRAFCFVQQRIDDIASGGLTLPFVGRTLTLTLSAPAVRHSCRGYLPKPGPAPLERSDWRSRSPVPPESGGAFPLRVRGTGPVLS
jgi:hypothetical protein